MGKYSAAALALLVTTSAFAGKAEREQRKTEEAESKPFLEQFKAACGFDVKFTVDWDSFKSADDMMRISDVANDIADAGKKVCDDDTGKKLVKKGLSEVKVSYGEVVNATAKGTVLSVKVHDISRSGGISEYLESL